MFTQQQLDIINTARYRVALNLEFILTSGNTVRWTTLPYDYDDGVNIWQHENYLDGVSGLKESTGSTPYSLTINIIGTTSMIAAFIGQVGSNVNAYIGVYKEKEPPIFTKVLNGHIHKEGNERKDNEVLLISEVTDAIGGITNTNARLLTHENQRNIDPNDECLKYIKEANATVFWGKGSKQ